MRGLLHFLVMYVGSAAIAAFLAACLSSPRVGELMCPTSGAKGEQRCVLVAELAAPGPSKGEARPTDSAAGPESPAVVVAY